jgi:hypothetical protein
MFRSLFPVIAAIGSFAGLTRALAKDPKNVIAAQLRAQGYQCEQPQNPVRDVKASKPNETVWVVECEQLLASNSLRLASGQSALVNVLACAAGFGATSGGASSVASERPRGQQRPTAKRKAQWLNAGGCSFGMEADELLTVTVGLVTAKRAIGSSPNIRFFLSWPA